MGVLRYVFLTLLFACVLCCISANRRGSSNLNITDGGYEFLYHRNHWEVKAVIAGENGPAKQAATLDEMVLMFKDIGLADLCHDKDIFLIRLDYIQCDFEQSHAGGPLCGWMKNAHSAMQWTLRTGDTPTLLTGPDVDHTLGTDAGQYLYLEANDGQPGDMAEVHSQFINIPDEGQCLRFWYVMYGREVGKLSVYAQNGPANVTLMELDGNQGNGWKMAEVSLNRHIGKYCFIVLRATRSTGTVGDIAIDDISSSPDLCAAQKLDCSFFSSSRNLCAWSQVSAVDGMDWQAGNVHTHSHSYTGPTHLLRKVAGGDYYAYTDGDTGRPGDRADLQSPLLQLDHPICLTFWYYMRGTGMGELAVILLNRDTMVETVLWDRTGDQTQSDWLPASVTITSPAPSAHIQVLLRSIRGSSNLSDIAIDEIHGLSGSCDLFMNQNPVIG